MKKSVLFVSALLLVVMLSFSMPTNSVTNSSFIDLNIEAFSTPRDLGAVCYMGCEYTGEIDCCVQCWDCHIELLSKDIGDRDSCN